MKYTVIITWNNTDPEVHGIFNSEKEAVAKMVLIQKKWDDHDWNHYSSIDVVEINN